MAQAITDYTAFFAEARQAVQELEQLNQREKELEEKEKELENTLKAKRKEAADSVSRTVKQRTDEISKSYDTEIGKTQERLKKVRAKREKAKTQGVKERIAEDTQGLIKENSEIRARIRTLFKANKVPGFCASGFYYSLYFTKGIREMGVMLVTLLLLFLALPCGIYFMIPERKTLYLIIIYMAVIVLFGGLYVRIGNSTKLKYMDVLKEGRALRDGIRANKKQIKAIAKSIRRDKNDAIYDLQRFDDEISQLDQDLALTNKKKKDALNTFETVTKTIISDEIMGNYKTGLDQLECELAAAAAELKDTRDMAREKSLFITDHFESYTGKEFMTADRLNALNEIIESGSASNISEAISVFKSREYHKE